MSGEVCWGAAFSICKTSNRTAKRYFLLRLAKICLLRSCPQKMSGGFGRVQPPPICKTSYKMRTCRFLLSSFARTCRFLLSAARSCLRMWCYKYERGVGGGCSPRPICKTSNRTAKRYFLLRLAKICLLRSCPQKMSGGFGRVQPTPFAKHLMR